MIIRIALHIYAWFAVCFERPLIQRQKRGFATKGGKKDVQRQHSLWLSAPWMCVLDCPLSDAAVIAPTTQERKKPLPATEQPRKMCPVSCVYPYI